MEVPVITRQPGAAPTHLPVLPSDAEAADGRGAHPAGEGGGAAAQLAGDYQLHEGEGVRTQQVMVAAGRRHSLQVTTSRTTGRKCSDVSGHRHRQLQYRQQPLLLPVGLRKQLAECVADLHCGYTDQRTGVHGPCRQGEGGRPCRPTPACVLESQRMPLLCSSASSTPSPPRSSGTMCCLMYLKRTSRARASYTRL